MDLITVEQIADAVREYGIFTWKYRHCSICSLPHIYRIHEGSFCSLDVNCTCSGGHRDWVRQTFDELADVFNNQTPERRAFLWADFIRSGTFER